MAPTFAFFTLLMSAAIGSAQNNYYYEPSTSSHTSAFWTITERLIDVYTKELYTYYRTEVTTESFLDTRTIKSDVTPTISATFTTTASNYYSDVEQVYLYYPTGAVGESDLAPETTRVYDYSKSSYLPTTTTDYEYFMPVTMTAPASCPTVFTVTSVGTVYVPSLARAVVTPTSVVTGATVSDRYGDTTVSETWYLSGGAAPYPTEDDFNYYNYIESCYTPPLPYKTASPTATSGTGGGLYYNPNDDDSNGSSSTSSSDSDESECYYYYAGCGLSITQIIIIVVSIVGGLFLLGFLESWFWFRRLMLGRTAMRLGTICWILITLLMMCATRIQDRRTKEDQVLLADRWKEMKAGAKFKAWLRFGFRHRYPHELLGQYSRMTVGIVPFGEPLHPAMEQPPQGFLPASQVYYYGPQWAHGPEGQPLPPQGYIVPAGQHAGYYGGEMAKPGVLGMVVSNVPVYPQRPQPAHTAPRSAVNTTGPSPRPGNSGPAPPSEPALPPLPPRPANLESQPESSVPQSVPQAPTSAPPPPPPVSAPIVPAAAATPAAPTSAPPPPPVTNTETSEKAPTQETPEAVTTSEAPPASSTPSHLETSTPQNAPQLPPIDLSESSASKAPQIPDQSSGVPPPKGDADNKSLYD
ncbi:hypothetical protein NX059_012051 [Plenodomus lindquistii]|nr:hypothetical protein NX059_012051 [Plenodomus lindquistii]